MLRTLIGPRGSAGNQDRAGIRLNDPPSVAGGGDALVPRAVLHRDGRRNARRFQSFTMGRWDGPNVRERARPSGAAYVDRPERSPPDVASSAFHSVP